MDYLYDTDGRPTWRMKETVEKAGITYGTHSLGPILDCFKSRFTWSIVSAPVHIRLSGQKVMILQL